MKIYVAGKFEDREIIREIMDNLEYMGHEITFDWTGDEQLTRTDYPIGNAEDDIEGVRNCDTFVGYFPSKDTNGGATAEMGAALISYKEVLIIGHGIDSCLFVNHPLVGQFESIAECLKFLGE